jgi:hypothetical protein
MDESCEPRSFWAKAQNQFFQDKFLINQILASEREIKQMETFKLSLLADLDFAQETYHAKIKKQTSHEMMINGITDSALIAILLESEKKVLDAEIEYLNLVIKNIPNNIKNYFNCSVKMENYLITKVIKKCEGLYYQARSEGASNRDIIKISGKNDSRCLN